MRRSAVRKVRPWLLCAWRWFAVCFALPHIHNRPALPPIGPSLRRALGGTALAWSAGFLAIPLPSGASLREVITIAILSPVRSVPSATVVAVSSRLISAVGDGVFAAIAVALARHNGLHLLAAARQQAQRDARLHAKAAHAPRGWHLDSFWHPDPT